MSAHDGQAPMSNRRDDLGWPGPERSALARALDRWRRAAPGRSVAPGRWGVSGGAGAEDAPVTAPGIGPPPRPTGGMGPGGMGPGGTSSGGTDNGGMGAGSRGAGDTAALAELARRLDDGGCAYGRVSAARLELLTRAYDRLETKLNAVLLAAMGTFLSTLASLLLYYARGGAH